MTPKNSQSHPLKIDSLSVPGTRGLLGLTFCPGKVQRDALSGSWERDLDTDLAAIKAWGATHLVTLNESHELTELNVEDLPFRVPDGIHWHHLPMPEGSAPTKDWEEVWNHHGPTLKNALLGGERVVLHCKGGLGRTGTIAAKLLIEFGIDPDQAIILVRQSRGLGAIENAQQEAYVRSLRPTPARTEPKTRPHHRISPDKASRYRGCLLAGAAGDALGAPIEFLKLPEILKKYGSDGLRELVPAYGILGAITDDTQMTLFTAEGMLRAHVSRHFDNDSSVTFIVGHAFQRWLTTQGSPSKLQEVEYRGLLSEYSELKSARAPGNTCLSALRAKTGFFEPEIAHNDSKGCGGVMRAAPVGLLTASLGYPTAKAFRLGAATAALTHGHPTGYLTAGVLAAVVHELVQGTDLERALEISIHLLRAESSHEGTLEFLEKAIRVAQSGPSRASLAQLGEGWVAEEALAIAVYCALTAPNLEEGLILAANHSGDSDSTAAIAGNLLGARYGAHEIPDRWLEVLELRGLITEMADDLASAPDWKLDSVQVNGFEANSELEYWQDRYPGK